MIEDQLIDRCLKGERKALEYLYNRYVPKMRGLCFRYARTEFEVDDILQEAFVKVFSKLNTYNNKGSFEGWIRRIVINTAINYFHSNNSSNLHVQLEEVSENEFDPIEIAEQISIEELYDIVNQLPSGYKFIFNMVAIDGYTHKEVSDALNITESTSRSQFARARKFLIGLLEKSNYVAKVR